MIHDTEPRQGTATEWLGKLLRAGPLPSIDVRQAARAAHFTEAQIERARILLGVESRRTDLWALPKETS